MVEEEALEFSGQFRADLVLSSGLDHPEEVLICDHGSADTAEDFRVHVPVVVDRHDHEKGRPDPLKVRIFELGVASGRTADKNRFPDRAGPAVQKRDPQFREDLRVEAFSLLDPVSQRRCRVQAVRYLHGHEL